MSTKSGPNGQALISSIYDLTLLTADTVNNLHVLGGRLLLQYMNDIESLVDSEKWIAKFSKNLLIKQNNILRKLSLVQDPEAKCRIIGILDYWSQTSLKPLHDKLIHALTRFKADCTLDQGHFTTSLPSVGPYYSLDLTKATDAFPLEFQRYTLECLVDKEYADSWAYIMTHHEFKVPWTNQPSYVKYEQGQPMGAYSSWAMFSLCHHIVVQLSAKRAGLKLPFNDYALLGDDIVLTNSLVTKYYKEIMAKMGVEFSPTKSHESIDTFEFAKRWFKQGVEITGAPLRSLLHSPKYSFVATLIDTSIERRWLPDGHSLITIGLIRELFDLFHSREQARYYAKKSYLVSLLPRRTDSLVTADQKLWKVLNWHYSDLLGCNGMKVTNFTKLFWYQTLAFQKIQLIETGIKESFKKLHGFIHNNDLSEVLNETGAHGQPMTILPPIRVALDNARELQEALDRYTDEEWYEPEQALDTYLRNDADLSFDPAQVFQHRSHEMILIKQSKILKQLESWLRDFKASRQEALELEGPSTD
jgi:hypothetical protein